MEVKPLKLLSEQERMKNNLEIKLLLKNVQINNKIIENRNKRREDFLFKFNQRQHRLENARVKSELMRLHKINSIQRKHMSNDLKMIHNKYKNANPYIVNNNYKNNQENISKSNIKKSFFK